jgi:predicted aldo/keto reductase-like oxidoreductase
MTELRNQCLAQAHDLGMGIIAMKVIAAGMLGAGSARVVPDFDASRAEQLPAAAIRFALDDERIQLLVIGMRVKSEIDANIETLQGDLAYTVADRALLAEFSLRAYESDTLKAMRVD